MINKDRIRARLANIANKNGPTPWWKCPKQGKATVRMFAYPFGDGDPFLEYFYHFNINKEHLVCPLKNGMADSCPFCEMAAETYNSDDPKDKEISKLLYAKSRYFGTVIDRADDTLTGKYWGFSQGLLIKFSTWLEEDGGDYENFMDPEEGLDLVVELENSPGKTFPAVTAQPKRRESPLAKNKDDYNAIMKSIKPAKEVFQALSTDELQDKLEAFIASLDLGSDDDGTNDTSEGTVKGKSDAPAAKPEKTKRVAKDVEEVFAENFPE